MTNKYWTEENQQSIENYYNCTTKEDKDRVFNQELIKPLTLLVRQCLYTYTSNIDEDKQQDLLILLATKTLPKLKEDKLKACFNLIWIACRRKIYTYHQTQLLKHSFYTSTNTGYINDYTSTCTNEYDTAEEQLIEEENKQLQRITIINELDKKIEEQLIVNKKSSVFLMLLKEYLVENDFDSRGFRTYCCSYMNLTKSRFSNICSTLKIINPDFNKPKLITDRSIQEKIHKMYKIIAKMLAVSKNQSIYNYNREQINNNNDKNLTEMENQTEEQQLQELLVDVKQDLNNLHTELNAGYQELRTEIKDLCTGFVDDLDKFFERKAALDKLNALDNVFNCCDADNDEVINKLYNKN